MRSRPPPSSFHNGWPSAFPLMSHSATSIADIAIIKMPAGPDEPAASRNFRAIASTRSGSSPMTSAPSSSTAWRKVRVSAPPKYVTPSPSIPSSVRSLSQTIGFLAFGFSENPASGSSFGSSTMPVSSEAIFIGSLLSCDLQCAQDRQLPLDKGAGLDRQLGDSFRGRDRLAILCYALGLRPEDPAGGLGPFPRCRQALGPRP